MKLKENYTRGLILFIVLMCSSCLKSQELNRAVNSVAKNSVQKPSLDQAVFDNWPTPVKPLVSNNGKYVAYIVENLPKGNETLVIQALREKWKKEIVGKVRNVIVTEDSRYIIYINKDSLCLLELGTSRLTYIFNVSSYKVNDGFDQWIAYKMNAGSNKLVVRNLATNKEYIYLSIQDYEFGNNHKLLLVQSEVIEGRSAESLNCVTLFNGKTKLIWRCSKISNCIFDLNGTQIAFIIDSSREGNERYVMGYYSEIQGFTKIFTAEDAVGKYRCAVNRSNLRFSTDGTKIFFTIKKKIENRPIANGAKVDIWSYKDARLQSEQLIKPTTNVYEAVLNIESGRVIQITEESDQIANRDDKENYILLWNQQGHWSEMNWKIKSRPSLYMISTTSGRKTIIKAHLWNRFCSISPAGNYIIYYDREEKNYFSYNTINGVTINLTKRIRVPLHDIDVDLPQDGGPFVIGKMQWVQNGQYVYIYDRFDIWQLDPSGAEHPINVTNSYGRKHNVVLRLASEEKSIYFKSEKKMLLVAFNIDNKDNGFYELEIGEKKDPTLLTMGPYIYHLPVLFQSFNSKPFSPVKAKMADVYIVRRMSSTEAPNFYVTRDFKRFEMLSEIAPEKNYNWLTAELVKWKSCDGSIYDGVLYKPENFDSTKTYPIIFCIYEKLSDRINQYLIPEASNGVLNIPFYVSNGYLVFTPDIHYKIGLPGQSAYNCVISAAKHLTKKTWVDSSKMGIQGHSFGGYEVNYIITHTPVFAAASSAAGPTDFISGYGSLAGLGFSLQFMYEWGQSRIGSTLWKTPELYIKNSPVFSAECISTPLLLMHNKRDDSVPWQQGIELFTALRRLQKKVWMLQYDNGEHQIYTREDMNDFSIRLFQFFNHYLMGNPPPKWMTSGIPADKKGFELGLDYDYNGIP